MNLVQRAQRKAFTSLNVFSCEAFIITKRIRTKNEEKVTWLSTFSSGCAWLQRYALVPSISIPQGFQGFQSDSGGVYLLVSRAVQLQNQGYMSQKDDVLIIDGGVMRQKDTLWTILWKRKFSWFFKGSQFPLLGCVRWDLETARRYHVSFSKCWRIWIRVLTKWYATDRRAKEWVWHISGINFPGDTINQKYRSKAWTAMDVEQLSLEFGYVSIFALLVNSASAFLI